jgi:hypothetical protein
MWFFTLRSEIYRSAAISRLLAPATIEQMTSRSRAVARSQVEYFEPLMHLQQHPYQDRCIIPDFGRSTMKKVMDM